MWLLLGAHTLIEVSREAQTDTIYAFGFLFASSAVLLDLNNGTATGRRWRWLYALGLFLVLFGKGPIGLFIAAYALIFLFLVDKRLAVSYVVPTCMACLPLGSWMVMQSLLTPDFLSVFLKQEYVPNYQPKEKAVSLEAARYPESCTVYTDSKRLAPIMHFYLNRLVYVDPLRRTPSEESILVSTNSGEAGREYSISSSCKKK